jgi:hypothetical protein
VPNGLVAKQIALGFDHACAIKLDDTLKCWGGLPAIFLAIKPFGISMDKNP